MRMKEKNNFWTFLKEIFIDVDYPEEKVINIERSLELKESWDKVKAMEERYSSSSSTTKSRKSEGVVEKVEIVAIDPKAVKAMEEKQKVKIENVKAQNEREA